jgi:hypothetical protein
MIGKIEVYGFRSVESCHGRRVKDRGELLRQGGGGGPPLLSLVNGRR